MKRGRTLVLFGALALLVGWIAYQAGSGNSVSERGTLAWHSFDDGLADAQRTDRKILVRVYTDWCRWCKKMEQEVYTDNAVTEILSRRFVVINLNAESSRTLTFEGESMSEAQFAQAVGATGYPSTLFLDSSGRPITLVPGFIEARRFASILTYIGEDYYTSMSYEDFLRVRSQ